MTDIDFENNVNRERDGRFAAKEGKAAAVKLTASTNDFRHAEDISQLIEDYEVLTSPENLYSDGEVGHSVAQARFHRYAAHGINRAAELADEEGANEAVGFAHQLAFQAGRPQDAHGAQYGKFVASGDQRRAIYFEGGSPVVEVGDDRAVVVAGSENGTITVRRGVKADIFVAEDARINIVYEDGASGRVISSSPRTTVRGTPDTEIVGNVAKEAWPGIHRGARQPRDRFNESDLSG